MPKRKRVARRLATRVGRMPKGYDDAMTTNPPDSTPAKDPEEWATGDEPATAAQMSYLGTLAQDSGTEVPADLTKAAASKMIDDLQDQSPRVSEKEDSNG
jgi:hypothetical protein